MNRTVVSVRLWFGDILCRLGLHKPEPRWERPMPLGWAEQGGGDCERCGRGPL